MKQTQEEEEGKNGILFNKRVLQPVCDVCYSEEKRKTPSNEYVDVVAQHKIAIMVAVP